MIKWLGQPDVCACVLMVVDDLADTLSCPADWRYVPETGKWYHLLWQRLVRSIP